MQRNWRPYGGRGDLRTHFHTRDGVVRAVDGVSLSLDRGETLGVVGESGCGKSVTALSVMRLVPPATGRIVAGSIRFDGMELLTLDPAAMRAIRGNRIGMIFQEPMTSLNPVMTVGRQIAESVALHQQLPRQRGARPGGRDADAREDSGASAARIGISASALRRHAAARDDRDRDGVHADDPHRRRADDGARRHDPGADPRPDARDEGAHRRRRHADHARSRRDRRDRAARRRDVRGPQGRAGLGEGALRATAPSVHARLDDVDPAAQSRGRGSRSIRTG